MMLITGAYQPGWLVNKHLFTWRLVKVGNSPGSCADNIYSPSSDELTEVQFYIHIKLVINQAAG